MARRLLNFGSDCYLNSTLQAISSCPDFVEEVRKLTEDYQDIETLRILNELLTALNSDSKKELNARRDKLFDKWKKTGQQDSFELFSYVIWQIYREFKNVLDRKDPDTWTTYQLPMRIFIQYKIKCPVGHEVKCPKQSSIALHVPIPKNEIDKLRSIFKYKPSPQSIQNLIDNFLKESEIEDYECDDCNRYINEEYCGDKSAKSTSKDKAKKDTNISWPLPGTICIHLQRTRWNGRSMDKINDQIKIDEEVTIKYTNEEEQQEEKEEEQKYELRSVVVHAGTPYFGHYVCYKRVDNKWYYTSDSSVRCYGIMRVPDCQAYILFYEKKQ